MTLNEVRQKIAEEEAREDQRVNTDSIPAESPLAFISVGLELESLQYV